MRSKAGQARKIYAIKVLVRITRAFFSPDIRGAEAVPWVTGFIHNAGGFLDAAFALNGSGGEKKPPIKFSAIFNFHYNACCISHTRQ